MLKKMLIGITLLIAVISVYHSVFDQRMRAASSTVYRAGGNITGRVNKAPSGISNTEIGVRKGDKILMGTKNPLNNTPLTWILLKSDHYNDYGCTTAGTYCKQSAYIDAWFSMTTQEVANTYMGLHKNDANDWYQYTSRVGESDWYGRYANSHIYNDVIKPLNAGLSAQDKLIVAPRNLQRHHDGYFGKLYSGDCVLFAKGLSAELFMGVAELGQHLFLPDTYAVTSDNAGFTLEHLPSRDVIFSKAYWSSSMIADSNAAAFCSYAVRADGTIFVGDTNKMEYKNNAVTNTIKNAVRPAVYLDLRKVVFAVSQSNTTGLGKVKNPTLPSSYTNILNSANGNAMKVRLENASLTSTTRLNQIQNQNGNGITKILKNLTVYLDANALAGSNANGVNTVSAIVFDSNNNFLYYKPLENAKGNGLYEFSLTDIPVGKYKIGIVNEVYNESSTAPTDSSAVTSVLPLEIVDPVSISVTPKTDLEVSKNVNQNDIVATYATKDGADPITTTLISDTSISGHENDYQLFSVSNGNVVVNNLTGLQAGDYYFKLNAIDSNGDPAGGVNSATVHISVAKTNLSVAFDESGQTKKSIVDAASGWSETATATPINNDVKITYSKVGGDIGLIDIDADTGTITYKGNGAYGKVKIRATADDDPSTGNDAYNSGYAEKEIVVYAQVNGSVTPHADSGDISTPTFSANDANVKINGTIGTIKGSPGTPDDVTGNKFTYTYGIKSDGDGSFFAVNASTGVITTKANLAVGSYSITVTVSDKWSTKEIPVTINVGMAAAEDLKFYENSSSNTAITTKSAKATDTNVTVYATVKGSSNSNPVKYKIKDSSTNIIEINEDSGAITIHGVGTVTIVAEKQGGTGQANATAELTFTVTAGAQNFIYTDEAGNELPKSGANYNALTETYAPNKTIQLYTAGNPTGSTVTYQLKAGAPTDVISIDSDGLVTILNASQTAQMGKVIVQATSHDPTGNYGDKTIELPINIDKGTRTISFAEVPIYVVSGKGQVVPVTEVDGVTDTDGDVSIEIDSNEDHTIAWTNDNKTIDYNYNGDTGKDIKIHATKPMNRNYKRAEADGILHIMGPDESMLAITSPGQIFYGDHFTIRSTQFDADSTNVQYKFEVDKTTYISNPTVNGNSAEFDAKQFSGSNKTIITVTRTADGETPLSKQVQVTVLPKPIEIVIDDKEKLKGEVNPPLTYQAFHSDLVSWNGVQDSIQENDIKLNTTAYTDSNAGTYPIKGDSNTLNKTYPNYSFTFKEGTLTIKAETVADDWYHLELGDGNNTAYTGEWTNKDVNLISDHNEYINLSLDGSTWNPNLVTVSKEGETNQSFWMKKDSGAITNAKQVMIRIDKTAPKVKNINGKDTNNKLQDIIHKLSFGIFFKPGTVFEITTSDFNDDLKVSGTKEIAYKVYKTEKQSRTGDELIKEGNLTVTDEKASITISELIGTYKVCITPTDHAGNTNIESCHEVELKKIDVDVDKDGKPDFNDPDGDGCPDLNIKWRNPDNPNQWIVVNCDRDGDGLPDLNIDSDGDGVPDLNIDTDNDGKPDLNLVILKKGDWKPTKCVKQDIDNGILEEYCTGTSVKAVINVDTDGDGIPNINIDNKGDFKPHINIAKDEESPIINVAKIHDWKPKKNYKKGAYTYDSIDKDDVKLELNIDTDGDGYPDINLDLDDDGIPDLNVDIDGDYIPDMNIDSTGDGEPDINVDTDGDGKPDANLKEITEWKPEKNVDGDFPYDTMDFTETDEPNHDKSDTSVKGQYNPVTSMGGANTGDTSNLMLFIGTCFITIAAMLFILFKSDISKK